MPGKQKSDADRRIRQSERLGRLLRLLHLIQGKGRWDCASLAEELGCSRRTVYRMLQTLSVAGVPWYLDDKTKSYRIRPGYRFPMVERESNAVIPTKAPDNLAVLVANLIDQTDSIQTALHQLAALLAGGDDKHRPGRKI